MIKFVDVTSDSFSKKRKGPRVSACDECRARKRRCKHGSESVPGLHDATTGSSSPARAGAAAENARQDISSTMNQSRRPSQPFIGSMNPAGVFLAAVSPEHVREDLNPANVGVWDARQSKAIHAESWESKRIPPSSLAYKCSANVQQLFLPVLREESLNTVPSHQTRRAICDVYFRKYHPIFPIVDVNAYKSLAPSDSRAILLDQAIGAVTCVDPALRQSLVLDDDVLDCKDFRGRILAAMRISIEFSIVTDKIVLAQALLLMVLASGGDGEGEATALLVARALQYLYTLGLHIPDAEPSDSVGLLMSCAWAIDRLNAAIHGRSVLMHERDIGIPLRHATSHPAYRLVLEIILLLDQVINLYRPNDALKVFEKDFALFDDFVVATDAQYIAPAQLRTVEILYHIVAMLSYRSQHPRDHGALHTAGKLRQITSADKISHAIVDQLVPFSFVPYAISLAMSVQYRIMRATHSPLTRESARAAFEGSCKSLRHLSDKFDTAMNIANKGNIIIVELDRVYSQNVDMADEDNTVIMEGKSASFHFPRHLRYCFDSTHVDYQADNNKSSTGNVPARNDDISDFGSADQSSKFDPFQFFDNNVNLSDMDAYFNYNLGFGGSTI